MIIGLYFIGLLFIKFRYLNKIHESNNKLLHHTILNINFIIIILPFILF